MDSNTAKEIITEYIFADYNMDVVNYSATSNRASCFKPLLPVNIYIMLTGLTQCPQALGFGSPCRTIVCINDQEY